MLPSEILGVEEPLAAYCVNRAVTVFGSAVEKEIDDVTDGKKKAAAEAAVSAVLAKWIGTPMKFANPTATRR